MKNNKAIGLTIYFVCFFLFLFIVNGNMLVQNEYNVFIESENVISTYPKEKIISEYGNNKLFKEELASLENKIQQKTDELKVTDIDSDKYKELSNTIDYMENNKYRTSLVTVKKLESKKKLTIVLILLDSASLLCMLFFILCNEYNKYKISDIVVIIGLTLIILFNIVMHGVINANSLEIIINDLILPSFILLYCFEYTILFKKVKVIED